ncbi:MAG: ATP synthase subunit b [Candidatus Falkowbacteria bacterium GW2011_GWC2_38_22]|uniref:ATP synthase subunit b n=1 Tax=Candidatus Falkowbacteria bacterium GW2011_GWE1_38_31 TaxID=1618638 RepID=A0A0G0N0Y0_9BACT|nr:MAG: ATP synthase subunit b [Candidatus Falkowbacteria bacterium GW2011_GWF2_38_1205]KKQ61932.1 MAG: ATP synthase subunit b [Candidatus Falkowbacteria bacterium GW2011_GWC2_38_22]KKQ63906.1 MAG: ATP synthase subunit b [Candidatus Falkowbacteria bacterium GW2011_GWF1_38_22]KKQ66163.1 MAG: ATP synthase subunit b [Candidatus Falkowbacteria bacterium GW2011_GWE2_38_254]KKQ70766.1 MAG: ATP synthase subunit b [Candidatus Falkowbacteria bacterium GW2011_GWE1_38_31]KKQ73136.1 MAG: ATP synthase subu
MFHVDVKLLIAQMLNFAIVIAILYFFALKPILAVMRERTEKIEKSLQDAVAIEENMKKTEALCQHEFNEAKKAAALIMSQAGAEAEKKREKMLLRTKEEIGEIINEEKEKMRLEKAQVLKEIKASVTDLVISVTEKVIEKNLDSKDNKELIKSMIK